MMGRRDVSRSLSPSPLRITAVSAASLDGSKAAFVDQALRRMQIFIPPTGQFGSG